MRTTKAGTLAPTLAIAVSAALVAQHAHAAELQEIVVTAQKREQTLSDVGLSVTALTGARLEDLRLSQAIDVSAQTPGLTAMNAVTNGTPIFSIRGMGLDDFYVNNNSSVAIFIDGVVQSTPIFLHGQVFDVERVEVLKGPQGTLYGKNASGGVINFISKAPTDAVEGYANLSYGNWDTVDVKAAIGGPLSEGVRGRVSASYENAGDWQRDRDTGLEYGRRRSSAVRAQLAVDLSERLTGAFAFRYSSENSVPASSQVGGTEAATDAATGILPGVLDYRGVPIAGRLDTGTTDPRVVRAGGLPARGTERGYGATMNWKYTADELTVESITGWDTHDHFITYNLDGNPATNFDVRGVNGEGERADGKQFYHEVRLGFRWGRTEWTTGVMYASDRLNAVQPLDASMLVPLATSPLQRGVFGSTSRYRQSNKSAGAYVSVDAPLNETVSLVTGARYSWDERGFAGTGTLYTAGVPFVITAQDESRRTSDMSYRVGLEYKPADRVLVFGNVATGYKNGVFYAGPPFNSSSWAYVPPEKVFGVELGVKATLLENRLSVTTSAFDYRLEDRQGFLVFITPPGQLGAGLGTIPKSRTRGGELELAWRPAERFTANLGVAYLDARVTDPPTDVRGFPLASPIVNGTRLALSPEWSTSATVEYLQPIGSDHRLRFAADCSYLGSTTATLSDPNGVSGSRAAVGGRIEWSPASERWSLSVWSRNLTDRRDDVRSVTDFFGGRVVIRQRPRTYGLEFRYRFF
ncbi:MAG: TonB-dependent receptor [Steroidobacteraceae bacterium]|nr:TonB-dependent receptor [Steroidobacteraceae bacterium]